MVSPVTAPLAFVDTEFLSSDVCKHGDSFKWNTDDLQSRLVKTESPIRH